MLQYTDFWHKRGPILDHNFSGHKLCQLLIWQHHVILTVQCMLACGICRELGHRNNCCMEHQGMDTYTLTVAPSLCTSSIPSGWYGNGATYLPDPEDTGTMVPLLVVRQGRACWTRYTLCNKFTLQSEKHTHCHFYLLLLVQPCYQAFTASSTLSVC